MIASAMWISLLSLVDGYNLEAMRNTECINMYDIKNSVGFGDQYADPYSTESAFYDADLGGFAVEISETLDCYISFEDELRTQYTLISAETKPAGDYVYKTHEGPCGVCSDLKNLATYLESTDLTSSGTTCSVANLVLNFLGDADTNDVKCFKAIGLQEKCAHIWMWNSRHTGEVCRSQCIEEQLEQTPNNEPNRHCHRYWFFGWRYFGCDTNYCDPSVCPNTINGGDVCQDFQWQDNQYRLNPCLQCDECNSGPIFQKIAGRTRRNSGIESAILRPDEGISFDHDYGL